MKRPGARCYTPDEIAYAVLRLREGLSLTQAAAELGRDRSGLLRMLKVLGYPTKPERLNPEEAKSRVEERIADMKTLSPQEIRAHPPAPATERVFIHSCQTIIAQSCRSKTPEGVRQEAWGYLCTHYAIRALMAKAADDRGVDPDRISFTRSLHAARRSVRAGLGSRVAQLAVALGEAIAEICRVLVPERRLRAAGRVVKRKMSNYGVKRAAHRDWANPTLPIGAAVRILSPP